MTAGRPSDAGAGDRRGATTASEATTGTHASTETETNTATETGITGTGITGTGTTTPMWATLRGEPVLRRMARAALVRAVYGGSAAPGSDRALRPTATGTWGAAILGEFEETSGSWEAVRWAASGVWLSWRERRTGRRLPGPFLALLWPDDRRRRLLVVSAATTLLAVLVGQFALTVRYVPSTNMQPTLEIGDRVVADRWLVRLTGAARGDLVLFRHRPNTGSGEFVVRVLGVAGDRMSCPDGVLWRNGSLVDEPYLAAGSRTDCASVTVPSGSVYLLGDHREVAVDSRIWGPVTEADVVGRVLLRPWPVGRAGAVD